MKMHTSIKSLIITILFFQLFSSCSKTSIGNIEYDKSKDFTVYKTYSFIKTTLDNQTTLEPHMENISKLKHEIRQQLNARGLKEAEDADLNINIGITLEEVISTRETTVTDAPAYIGQRNYSWRSETIETGRYEKGTAIVHLVDSKENKLVWEGAAKGAIDQDQEKMRDRIHEAIQKLFTKYPVDIKR